MIDSKKYPSAKKIHFYAKKCIFLEILTTFGSLI